MWNIGIKLLGNSSNSLNRCFYLNTKLKSINSLFLLKNLNQQNNNNNKMTIRLNSDFINATSANRKERKRFYRNATVTESSVSVSDSSEPAPVPASPTTTTIDTDAKTLLRTKLYEINLDKRKLKTPGGKLFQVNSELLANMIAFEWNSQLSTIKHHTMHLTSLVNTCMDNPTKQTQQDLIKNITEYLKTDTLLFFDNNSIEKLDNLQNTKWRPLVEWFNTQYDDLNLKIIYEIDSNAISSNDTQLDNSDNKFHKYLQRSFSLNSLIAFNYIVECLKSVILTVCLLERHIQSVDEACRLASLEHEHQYEQWGKVEWHHDISEAELRSRVSAALLFIYLSNDSKYFLNRDLKSL